jgi:mRNA-degrading endonuclease RelE of RelBE toxin-antitoxin system
MAYKISFPDDVSKVLKKLYKKDKLLYERIDKKVNEISLNPKMGKPMESYLKGSWRVHIGHFVLMYTIDERNRIVEFYKIEHHDKVYH